MKIRNLLLAATCSLAIGSSVQAADKPNILIIWGDDIGQFNLSYNNRGMMGYKTPNIDRELEHKHGIDMVSRAVPLVAQPSSLDSRQCVLVSLKWAYQVLLKD